MTEYRICEMMAEKEAEIPEMKLEDVRLALEAILGEGVLRYKSRSNLLEAISWDSGYRASYNVFVASLNRRIRLVVWYAIATEYRIIYQTKPREIL